MWRNAIVVAACFAVSACATQYQRQGFSGGYTETQLDNNVYRVSFRGNGYTSAERAADFNLLRCAELTLQNGYKYFAVVEGREGTNYSTYTTPTQTYTTGSAYVAGNAVYGNATTTTYGGRTFVFAKPSSTNTIIMLRERNEIAGMTYDAKFLYNSLSSKYEVGRK